MASDSTILSVKLPKEAFRDFHTLVQNIDVAEKIDNSIAKFNQGLSFAKYSESIAADLKIDASLALSVIRSLSNLHMMRSKLVLAPAQLVAGIEGLIKKQANNADMPQIDSLIKLWGAEKDKLSVLVSSDRPIATFQKAKTLVLNDENNLVDAQCITDVRPVFDEEGERITAYLILSQLRLRYQDAKDHNAVIQLSLDADDLRNLKDTIERAERKHSTLIEETKKLGKPVILVNGED